ncbi:phosphate ABC transporter substrate-binding protein [Paraburkholderia tropica]|uniref:phosphate ABC transporter substrate-binding protein n=1 Tax=Paraburkholderia tropica TaxID=92647 RepID=UPI0007EE01A1|nr:phosphate ABC transporter substrate-binding protein [Paraburkholderia tropica]OBR50040.1 phosphate ABC transporter substrate-binding protein [Paraburkholderia tropica]
MSTLSASRVTLRTNLADYPNTRAIREGRVSSDLVYLDTSAAPKSAHDGFKPMVRDNAFDAGELALVTYLQARVHGKPYVLLPVPIVGRLQHHCIGFNRDFGHMNPKDIEGRKVGVRTYAQTTGLWVRGILQHEYGVDMDKVHWMTIDEGHLAEYDDPGNCERLPKGSSLAQLMLDGELSAAIMGMEMPSDPRIATLIPEPLAAAEQWSAREGLIPLNHLFVVPETLSRERPDVVREIFRLLAESRSQASAEALKTLPPIGLEPNRKGIALAIDWAYEQKIIPRRLTVDELFDDTTASLTL